MCVAFFAMLIQVPIQTISVWISIMSHCMSSLKVFYLTTSKTVPQSPIDDAPGSVKGGSTPLCVIV